MKVERHIERRFLPEMIRIFEDPAAMATKYTRLSYACFAGGVVILAIAAVLSVIAVAIEAKELLLILGGAAIGASLFYRLSAQQIPVLTRYAAFRLDEAKGALDSDRK